MTAAIVSATDGFASDERGLMAVIAGCIALVLAGAAMIVRWGGAPPRPATDGPLRYAGVALAAGVVAGLLAAGAGGRLVMRLLALTSPAAEGSFTEAGEIIGEITFAGTVGFILFTGLAAGLLSAVLYALVRPVLPPGRAGGLALGLLLLVVAGTQGRAAGRGQHRLRRPRARLAGRARVLRARPLPRDARRGRGRRGCPGSRRRRSAPDRARPPPAGSPPAPCCSSRCPGS